MIRKTLVAGLISISLSAAAAPAEAQSRVRSGVLTCTGAGLPPFVVGSVHNYACIFRPQAGRRDRYRATIRRFGSDLDITGREAIAWVVFAPTRRIGPGALSGTYGGTIAAAAAVGHVLVGGSNNAIALQPTSMAMQPGVNVAAGIVRLELRPR